VTSLATIASVAAVAAVASLSACSTPARDGEPARAVSARSELIRFTHAMNEARGRFACVELAGGAVLAVGSDANGGTYSSTAEVFDPAGARWTLAAGKLTQGRWEHSAIRLADGRVLVAGGFADNLVPPELSTVEIYDPSSRTFTSTAAMATARKLFGLARLSTGEIVAVAGEGVMGVEYGTEVWAPATGQWRAWPSVANSHAPSQAVALADDSVLVIGGMDLPERVTAASAKTTGAMNVPRDGATLTLLGDGTALAVGGRDTGGVLLSSAEIYDPKGDAWTLVGSMARARYEHTAVRVTNGLVLVAGGESSGDVEAYDPTTKKFVTVGFLGQPREALCGASQGDGALFLGGSTAGGYNTYVALAERWSPSPAGDACTLGAECASGVCTSTGTCAGATDAGADAPATDTLAPSDGGFEAGASATPIAPSSFQRCSKNAECGSGHCVEGICCDTACDQKCFSCALPSSPGKCAPEPVGVDLKAECGGALTCTGTCGPAHECVGSGAGAQCARSRCTSASSGVGAAVCTAQGAACPIDDAITFDCDAYACAPAFGTCFSSCSSSTDCAGGYLCDGERCVAPPPSAASGGCALGAPGEASRASLALALATLAAWALGRRRGRLTRSAAPGWDRASTPCAPDRARTPRRRTR
jgi:hypothetical protein